jgi:hypothetical protein
MGGHGGFEGTVKQKSIVYSLYKISWEINPLYKDIREEKADLRITYGSLRTAYGRVLTYNDV